MVTAPQLGGYGPLTLHPQHHDHSSPPLWTLKKHMAGKQFATDAIMKQAVTSWLQTLVTDLFHARV